MKHISEIMLEHFDKLHKELTSANLLKEANKVQELKNQVLLKRAGTKKVHLRAYYKSFDSVPFFNEEILLPDYASTGKINLDSKEYVVLDAETYNNPDLTSPIVRLLVTN